MTHWVMPVPLLVIARVAHAQTTTNVPDDDGGMLQWGVALGIAVLVVLTGFLNSKRSHLN